MMIECLERFTEPKRLRSDWQGASLDRVAEGGNREKSIRLPVGWRPFSRGARLYTDVYASPRACPSHSRRVNHHRGGTRLHGKCGRNDPRNRRGSGVDMVVHYLLYHLQSAPTVSHTSRLE